MNARRMRVGATAPVVVILALLANQGHSASQEFSKVVADSVGGFSGQQGENVWSYGYWDRTADTGKSCDQATDFQPLRPEVWRLVGSVPSSWLVAETNR